MDGVSHNTSMPRRIALFSGNFNYLVDGAARALNRLANHLQDSGIEVMIFSPTRPEAAFPPVGEIVSVPSIPLPGRGEYLLGLGLNGELKRKLDRFQPDLIHISAPDIIGWSAMKYAKSRKLPSVASFHTRYDSYTQYYGVAFLEGALRSWLRHIHRKADRVLAPTEETKQWLSENNMAQSIGFWARGVDTQLFNPQRRSLEMRRSLGIEDDAVVILFVGRLVMEKGLKQFARVVNAVRAQGKKPEVLIVGAGPADKVFKDDLGDAHFVGFKDAEDLATAYASADILLNPSVTEAFPNVVLEAMASGLPTVCADTIGARTVVLPGETGYLAPADSDETYVKHVSQLIDDADLRAKLGAAGVAASKRFSWPSVLDEVIHNYQEVIGAHHQKPSIGL